MTHNSDDVPRAEPENIPHGRSMALLSFSRSLSLSVCVWCYRCFAYLFSFPYFFVGTSDLLAVSDTRDQLSAPFTINPRPRGRRPSEGRAARSHSYSFRYVTSDILVHVHISISLSLSLHILHHVLTASEGNVSFYCTHLSLSLQARMRTAVEVCISSSSLSLSVCNEHFVV